MNIFMIYSLKYLCSRLQVSPINWTRPWISLVCKQHFCCQIPYCFSHMVWVPNVATSKRTFLSSLWLTNCYSCLIQPYKTFIVHRNYVFFCNLKVFLVLLYWNRSCLWCTLQMLKCLQKCLPKICQKIFFFILQIGTACTSLLPINTDVESLCLFLASEIWSDMSNWRVSQLGWIRDAEYGECWILEW